MNRLLSVVFLAALATAAPGRTFTDKKGQTSEATLVSADAFSAALKGKDGKTRTVPIESLSEADQKFCRDWLAANPPVRLTVKAVSFTAKGSRESDDNQGRSGETSTISRSSSAKEGYRITVSNWSKDPRTTVGGLKIHYALVVGYTDTKAKDRRGVKRIVKGSADVPELTGSTAQTISTQTVSTGQSGSVATRTDRDSSGERHTSQTASMYRESLDGICLVIKHGKRVVATHTSGRVPKNLPAEMEK